MIKMIKLIIQIATGTLGALAIWLVGRKNYKISKWGYVVGLISQPFWFITYLLYEQYYLLIPLGLYSWAWYQGYKNKWHDNEN